MANQAPLGIHEKTLRAFTPRAIRVDQIDIQPATMAHIMALRLVCPAFEGDELDFVEMLSAIVVFSTPAEESAELLTLTDEEWEQRRRDISGKIMLHNIGAYAEAIAQQINSALAPAIAGEDAGQKKTASAGGSKSMKGPSRNTAARRKS